MADEVRKLAEESQAAAGEIAGIISSIQQEAQRTVDSMQAGMEQVKGGSEAVSRAGTTFGILLVWWIRWLRAPRRWRMLRMIWYRGRAVSRQPLRELTI